MDTRFILPATFATAFHALVFFGFKVTPGGVIIRDRDPVTRPAAPFVINIEDPPEPLVDPEAGAAQPKGHPEDFLPQLDETPPRPSLYQQESARINPRPDVVATRIASGPVGFLDGTERIKSSGIVNSINLDNPPRTRSQVPPSYPLEARNAGLTGEVSVEFVVDETGRVLTARVVKSTDSCFDAATLRAVQKWRFEPGKKNGHAVRFRMVAPVVFSLNS